MADPSPDAFRSAEDGQFELEIPAFDHQGAATGVMRLDAAALVEAAARAIQVLRTGHKPPYAIAEEGYLLDSTCYYL